MSGTTAVSKFAWGRVLFCTAALGAIGLVSAPARAGFVALKASPGSGEANHADILSHYYGGSFQAAGNGLDFTNGSVTATRVDDADAAFWHGGKFTANVVAKFAGWQQNLGFMTGTSGGTYTNLLDAQGKDFDATGSVDVNLGTNATWRWARGGDGPALSSLGADNGGFDQLVTYKVHGLNGKQETYLLFWEDVSSSTSDRDYNDLVVEIKSASSQPAAVPLPPAAWTGLTVMLGAGVTSLRNVRRWFA